MRRVDTGAASKFNVCGARIDDADEGFEEDDLQHMTRELGSILEAFLPADGWRKDLGGQGDDPEQGRCLGIRCNIWARAQRRREITHQLLRGGTRNIG